jgi:hypothetical protein
MSALREIDAAIDGLGDALRSAGLLVVTSTNHGTASCATAFPTSEIESAT